MSSWRLMICLGPMLGCSRMAEHVDAKAAPVPLELADISGDWRTDCSKDALLGDAEDALVYVQMRLVIPEDGQAQSGGIVGRTRFEDAQCAGEGLYQVRSVSYALERSDVASDVYVLRSTLEEYDPEDPYTTSFIALQADPDAGTMILDIDGESDRFPLTEWPADPDATWGWFAEDPQARGVLAVRVSDATESQ